MRLQISHAELAPDLLRFLQARIDVVAAQVGETELLVGLLGSRSTPYQRRELEARVGAWRRAHPHADVVVG